MHFLGQSTIQANLDVVVLPDWPEKCNSDQSGIQVNPGSTKCKGVSMHRISFPGSPGILGDLSIPILGDLSYPKARRTRIDRISD